MSKQQDYESRIEESRAYLEEKALEDLEVNEHVALAIHRIADLIEEYIESILTQHEDEDEDE